jgi:RNA polymerase sigma-70 factor (ECF subfamily)
MEKINPAYVASLVKRAQENDSDAFAELYLMTYKQQYLFARNYLRDDYLAQDAVQEVYILALKNILKLKERRVFPAWIRQINLRVCYDMARKLKEHPEEQQDDEVMNEIADENISNNPEASTMRLFENQDLNNALNKLPLEEKEALLLKYSAEMKFEEIAKTMNVSVSTVTRYLNRGEQHLTKIMTEGGK